MCITFTSDTMICIFLIHQYFLYNGNLWKSIIDFIAQSIKWKIIVFDSYFHTMKENKH